MSDTLSLNKLEKIIELETQLRDEYQKQLDDKDSAMAELKRDKAALETQVIELEKTIATQLAAITELSGKSNDTQALEQRNRELHNRSENMKEEVAAAKSRLKILQKDLAAERAELAELKKKSFYEKMRGKTKFGGAQRTLSRMVKKHYKTVTKQVSNYWKRKMPKSIEASVRKQYGNLPKAQLDVKIKNSQISNVRLRMLESGIQDGGQDSRRF